MSLSQAATECARSSEHWPSWRFFARLLLASVVCASPGTAAAQTFKVMSFNILADFLSGPNDQWLDPEHPRRDRVGAVLSQENADIIGLQEVTTTQLPDLISFLPDYDYVTGPMIPNTLNNVIFYKRDRFQLEGSGIYQTPSWLPNATVWARLLDTTSGESLVPFVVHLNPFEGSTRLLQAQELQMAMPLIAGDLPKILMGDFNLRAYESEVDFTPTLKISHTMTEHFLTITGRSGTQGAFLVDAGTPLYGETASFSNRRIDYITHSDVFEVIDGQVVTTLIDGRRPSDHRPVTSLLSLTPEGAERRRWPVQSHVVSDARFEEFDGIGDILQLSFVRQDWQIGTDADIDTKLIMKFTVPNISASAPAIQSAVLRIYVTEVQGTLPGGLSLMHSIDDNDFQVFLSDYQASYLDTGLDLIVPAGAAGQYHELDVTAFVMADALADGSDPILSAFRLEIGDGHELDPLQQHFYVIDTRQFAPQLVITFVPEIGTAWFLLWGSVAITVAQQRRNRRQ